MLLLVLQLILFMFLLIVNGEPFRFVFLRPLKIFSDMDFIQNCILDVYLGGLTFYVLAILPFRLFNLAVVFWFTLFCFFFSIYIHFRTLRCLTRFHKIRAFLVENKTALFDYAIVFVMFLTLLIINLISSSNFVFGSVFDESIHSLKVEVILENNYLPSTLQPYLPEGIIYPQAAHVIFAFACYMLNFLVPKSVFYVTILFKALSVFGAYFLGKKLNSARIYPLGLSFVFAFISSWPLYVVWGGNPFLVGFPLFLVNLGLFFSLLRYNAKVSFAELVAVGLLFGYNGAVIVSYIETLTVVAFFVCVYWLVRKRDFARRKLFEFFVMFSVSLLPLSPVLYRFFAFYPYPGHNIGLPADFAGYQTTRLPFTMTQALQWAFENLSPYYLLRLLTLFLLASFAVLLWRTRDYKDVKSVIAFALTIFISATLLSFISFFLPSDLEVISWGHQGVIIAISMNILIVAFYVKLAKFCRGCNLKRASKFFSKSFYPNVLLAIMLFTSITAPFLYYRFLVDPEVLGNTYKLFAITTRDDYDLMVWMKGNLSRDAVILVSPYESGSFIPSISHHRIVFPCSGSAFTRSYQTLVNLLLEDVLKKTVYDLMLNLSVSHVFVGSDAGYWLLERRKKLNPMLFLGNPNFKLVKNFSEAYLFQFNYTHPDVVFLDDFEHTRWNENGWQTYFYGNGLGNVTITNNSGCGSEKCLEMASQAVYNVTELKYARYIVREIFVQNNSDVTLSFYLNATEGFNGEDTFATLVSNIYRNQSITITTPDGVYESYSHNIPLERFEGFFTFNLSAIWRKTFNSSVPDPFILEFANWDFDGIKNVAYIDNVTVTSTPPA